MNRLRNLLLLIAFVKLSLDAMAFDPKLKTGSNEDCTTGINDGDDGSEVKLPIGLPIQLTDPSTASGSGDNGATHGNPAQIIYTFDIPDGAGPQSIHETHSAFQQARSMNAACVLIRMNSISGALNAAENISQEISDYDRPVMVYVNDHAISATKLISMASDSKKKQQAPAKPVHKSTHNKTTAKQTSGETYSSAEDETDCTSSEALFNAPPANLDAVLAKAGMDNYKVVRYKPGFFAQVIDFCMQPFVSLILVLLIGIGMQLQRRSAFPGPATFLLMVAMPLFAVPLFMGALAGPAELVLLFGGAIALQFAWRNKTVTPLARVFTTAFFIMALMLCQWGKFTSWQELLQTLALTTMLFAAGWFFPLSFRKFTRPARREKKVAVTAAA